MDQINSGLKKITRPVLTKVIERKRLFRILDHRKNCTVTWISGIAGSGKTTLAASYLDTRHIPCLWYRLDERDSDPATFFYYFRNASQKALIKSDGNLPLFTRDYNFGASSFSRQYFEYLCTKIKQPFCFVFDDYQTISPDTPFHEVFQAGISEIMPHIHILILSRQDPPVQFARMLADNSLRIAGKNDLLMTPGESRKILQNQLNMKINREMAEKIFEKTQGWAAGLILMAKGLTCDSVSRGCIDRSNHEKAFDYFAGELFNKADKDTRDFLLKTALLPGMTTAGMADILTDRNDSEKILASLEQNRMFTERHNSVVPTYEYHPLFRDFLISTAENTFTPEEMNIIRKRAASILSASDHIEEAAELYIQTNDSSGLIHLIETYGRSLIEQGRGMTIARWYKFIPEEALETSSWSVYWFASGCQHMFPSRARSYFEQAFYAFEKQHDMTGLYLSWTGIIESTIYEWNDFTVLDPWIQWMEKHLLEGPQYPSPGIEAKIAVNIMCALLFRQPDHADMIRWVEKALSLARKYGDTRLRTEAWDWAITFYCWLGNFPRAEILKEENRNQMKAYLKNPAVMLHLKWLDIATGMFYGILDESVLEDIIESLRISAETGIHAWDPMFLTEGVYASIILGKTDKTREFFEKIESSLHPSRYHGYTMYHIGYSLFYLLTGDNFRALEHARKANDIAEETGYIFPLIICRFGLAQILAERNEFGETEKLLDSAIDLAVRTRSHILEFMCTAAKARILFKQGIREKGINCLEKAMSLGRFHDFKNMIWWWQPAMMSDIVIKAFELGIEVEYAKVLHKVYNVTMRPTPYHIDTWPWPLKINTLGRFEILKDDNPVEIKGRAHKKPLDLLKAIISYGSPDIAVHKIVDSLWPDSNGDQAYSAFSTTLNRLRVLLGIKEVIRLRDGIIMVDESICRIDTGAFTHFILKADQLWEKGEKEQAVFFYEKAFACYDGNFLEEEGEILWIVSFREQLKELYIKAVTRLGIFCEEQHEYEKAVDLYSMGLTMDQTNEILYQRSMTCCNCLGRHGDIEKFFRRCEEALRKNLDIEPSHTTSGVYTHARSSQRNISS